jgi:hypothetical protein
VGRQLQFHVGWALPKEGKESFIFHSTAGVYRHGAVHATAALFSESHFERPFFFANLCNRNVKPKVEVGLMVVQSHLRTTSDMNNRKHQAKITEGIVVNYLDAIGKEFPRMVQDAAARGGLKDYAGLEGYELEPFTVMLWAQFTGATKAVLHEVAGREVELPMPPQIKALAEKWNDVLFPKDPTSPSGN